MQQKTSTTRDKKDRQVYLEALVGACAADVLPSFKARLVQLAWKPSVVLLARRAKLVQLARRAKLVQLPRRARLVSREDVLPSFKASLLTMRVISVISSQRGTAFTTLVQGMLAKIEEWQQEQYWQQKRGAEVALDTSIVPFVIVTLVIVPFTIVPFVITSLVIVPFVIDHQ